MPWNWPVAAPGEPHWFTSVNVAPRAGAANPAASRPAASAAAVRPPSTPPIFPGAGAPGQTARSVERPARRVGAADMSDSQRLRIYLQDHYAGARGGLDLAGRAAGAQKGTPLGD